MRNLNDRGRRAHRLASHPRKAMEQRLSYRGAGQSCTVCPCADHTGQPAAIITMNSHVACAMTGSLNEHHARFTRQPGPGSTGQAGEPPAPRADHRLPPESRARPRHNNRDSPADSGVTTPDATRAHDCCPDGKGNHEAGRQAARWVLPRSGSCPAGGTRRAHAGAARQPAGDQQ